MARPPVKRDYDYETVRIGVVRPTMLTNHALLTSMEAPIGRAVTTQSPQALKLTHGVKNVYDGGASEGLFYNHRAGLRTQLRTPTVFVHKPARPKTAPPAYIAQFEVDHIAMNKLAITRGLIDTQGHKALRTTTTILREVKSPEHPPPVAKPKYGEMTHGIKSG